MINIRKTRLMTKLAMFEQGEGKQDIARSKYYKTDFVRLQVLKTAVSVTIAYLLILLLVGIYKSEYLIEQAVNLDYPTICTVIVVAYIILMIVFIVGTIIGYSIYYDLSRKKLSKYYRMLKIMRRLYDEEAGINKGSNPEEESNG